MKPVPSMSVDSDVGDAIERLCMCLLQDGSAAADWDSIKVAINSTPEFDASYVQEIITREIPDAATINNGRLLTVFAAVRYIAEQTQRGRTDRFAQECCEAAARAMTARHVYDFMKTRGGFRLFQAMDMPTVRKTLYRAMLTRQY